MPWTGWYEAKLLRLLTMDHRSATLRLDYAHQVLTEALADKECVYCAYSPHLAALELGLLSVYSLTSKENVQTLSHYQHLENFELIEEFIDEDHRGRRPNVSVLAFCMVATVLTQLPQYRNATYL